MPMIDDWSHESAPSTAQYDSDELFEGIVNVSTSPVVRSIDASFTSELVARTRRGPDPIPGEHQ